MAQARTNIAVIGAGIIGCLVARELIARDLGAPVTVLDRDAVGTGASRRSAGLHLPRGHSDRTRRMSAYSHAYYADLKRSHPGLPIHPVGATVVTGPARELIKSYLPEAAPVPVAGNATETPHTTQVTSIINTASVTKITSAAPTEAVTPPNDARTWRITGAHYCDVYGLAQALAAQLRPQVSFVEGVEVTDLIPQANGVTVRCGTGETLTVGKLVLAPGPWLAAPAWRDLLVPLGLRVKRVVALHVEKRPGPADEAVLFDTDDAFLLPLAHRGHWLFSYSSLEWDVDPDRPANGLSAKDLQAARDCLRRHSPVLAEACHGGRAFCDAYSPDREPVVRPIDPQGSIVFAGAACGSGYRLGPAIAAEAADLVSRDLVAHRSEGVTDDRQHV